MHTKIHSYTELNNQYSYYEESVNNYLRYHPQVLPAFLKQQKKHHPHSDIPLEVSDQMKLINKIQKRTIFSAKLITKIQELEKDLLEKEIQLLGL